jgi:DNA-directed RNA polymerase alpha subunit
MIIKLEFEDRQEHNDYCLHVVKSYTSVQVIPLLEYQRLQGEYNRVNNLYGETKIKLIGWERFYERNKKAIDAIKEKIKDSRKVEDLNLSQRTLNCLKHKDIKTFEDLCNMTEKELLALENFGRKALNEVKDSLKEFNLRLLIPKVTQ